MDPTKQNQPTEQNSEIEPPKPTVAVKGNPADLFAKFAPKTIPQQFEEREQAAKIEEQMSGDKDDQRISAQREEEARRVKAGKKPGFISQKIGELEETKKQLQEAQEKLSKLTEIDADKLTAKIQELESKLAESSSKREEAELQKRIEEAERQREELYNKYNEETKKLRERLDFYELESNPEFHARYIAPMQSLYQEATQIVAASPELKKALQQALAMNEAALRNYGSQESIAHEAQRDEVISDIIGSLPAFHQQRFAFLMNDFIRASRNHAEALINHQQTTEKIAAEINQKKQEEVMKARKLWTDSLARTKSTIAPDIKIDSSLEEVIKTHNIVTDNPEDEQIAAAIVTDSSRYTPDDVTRVINQGAAYSKLRAVAKAQEIKIRELREVISKLQGAAPAHSGSQSRTAPAEQKSLGSFLNRFSPAGR